MKKRELDNKRSGRRHDRLAVFCVAALALLFTANSSAAQWSLKPTGAQWAQGHGSKVRMITGSMPMAAGVQLMAGVEIEMEKGWKTYWRHPGDSGGLPPHFDWSASTNLKSASVSYPAPLRMRDVEGYTIGYEDHVVFPVIVEPVDPTKSVKLTLNLMYGICREICVPANATFTAILAPGGPGVLPAQLARAIADVPKPMAKAGPDAPRLKSVSSRLDGEKTMLTIDIATPRGADTADLFATSETAAVPVPRKAGQPKPGIARFTMTIDTADEAAQLKGKTLTFVMVANGTSTKADWIAD